MLLFFDSEYLLNEQTGIMFKKRKFIIDDKIVKETLSDVQLQYVTGMYKTIWLHNLFAHQTFLIKIPRKNF